MKTPAGCQLKRVAIYDRMIRAGGSTAAKLAVAAGVVKRQTLRDLRFMRDELKAPLIFDQLASHGGGEWDYDEPEWDCARAVLRWLGFVQSPASDRVESD